MQMKRPILEYNKTFSPNLELLTDNSPIHLIHINLYFNSGNLPPISRYKFHAERDFNI